MTHTSDKHVTDEELELVTRGKADGIYMKAPNGSPTSLNERQWVQVRTRAFKNWFGDWENVPEAASRIPDDKYGNEQWTEEGYVYDLYVNSRNPFDPKDGQAVKKILQSLGSEIPVLSFYGGKGGTVSPEKALELASSKRNCWMLTETPEFLSKVREAGYDGLVGYDEGVKYIAVMSPGQLKDAYENTGAFSTSNDDIRFRQVYHGSPASLGHFDHAFTGTGEGAQAYGWGTYVTEVKGIARKYAAIGIKRGNHITYDGEPLSPVLDNEYYFDEVWRIWKRQILSSTDVDSLKRNISSVYMDGRTASAYSGRRKAFERQKQELLSDIDAGRIRIEPPRHLYTVEIPEDNGMNYLYWDRPVSAEQQGKIFLQLRKERFFFPEATAEFWSGRSHVWNSGKEFYGFLDYMFMNPDRDTDSQRLASGFLSRAGFTGIDYPAECSTGGRADGARNYVIFSEADLKITAHERFRFIGEKGASRLDRSEGASLRLENLAVAREMEKSGKDAGTIKAATGWERGADSKWRYETADFEYHPAGDLGYSRLLEKQSWHGELENLLDRQIEGETLSEAEWKRFEKLTELAAGLKEQDALRERIYLDDYVKDDELFQAYPEMKRTRLEFVDLPSADYCGGYLHPDNRIVINISRTDDVRSVLAHEIQHAIQTMEGFARGSNPGEFKNTVENVILDIVRATDGRILEGGGFDNTPKGIFAALDRKVPYGTILRHYDYPLSLVAEKYGYENIFDLVNDIGRFKSGIQEYRSTAGEVEARNVESRLDFTSAQRRNTLAVSTEDIARNGQIFLSRDVRMDELARHVSFLAGKLHIPVEVIRHADEVGSPDIRGLLSCGKDIRGWYDIPSQRVCLYLPHVRGKRTSSVPCCMRVWHITASESLQVTSIWMLFWMTSSTDAEKKYGMRFSGWRLQTGRTYVSQRKSIWPGWPRTVRTNPYGTGLSPPSGISFESWASAWKSAQRELRGILAASRKNLIGIAEPTVIQTARGDLELSCGYGRAVLRRQGVETDVTSLLERMRKAGISPASLGQEDWKAVFNGGIILPGGRKLMAVREPAGYGMRISGVSPGSTRESGMEM